MLALYLLAKIFQQGQVKNKYPSWCFEEHIKCVLQILQKPTHGGKVTLKSQMSCCSKLFPEPILERTTAPLPASSMIVMVTFDFLIQLYLLLERKRNRKNGYGRIVAERPTGSRAGCRSASGGSRTPGPVRTPIRPNQRATTPNRQPAYCLLEEKGGLGGL